ncbi:MAG: sigma-70 family RNA polymerase sigma factor [Bacteroidales bacterium]|nr:sigma-70 family RNA polymerase sigma factor [Bacteroidales bacterium]
MSPDETDLIERIVLYNDHRAFGCLIDKYQSEVRNLFYKMTNGDRALTDDLSQEVFIRIYKHLRDFRADAKFSTWLHKIAVHVMYDHQRVMKYPNDVVSEKHYSEAESIQNRIDIFKALKILNVKEKTAIILHYEKGFSHNEIAEIMKLPLGTVKSNILRGKAKLKDYLSDEQKR